MVDIVELAVSEKTLVVQQLPIYCMSSYFVEIFSNYLLRVIFRLAASCRIAFFFRIKFAYEYLRNFFAKISKKFVDIIGKIL